MPAFSRFVNDFVRKHLELLDSSLSFLLENGAQLLDLATKKLWIEQKLGEVRREVRAARPAPRNAVIHQFTLFFFVLLSNHPKRHKYTHTKTNKHTQTQAEEEAWGERTYGYSDDTVDDAIQAAVHASRADYCGELRLSRGRCWWDLVRMCRGRLLLPDAAAFFRRRVRCDAMRCDATDSPGCRHTTQHVSYLNRSPVRTSAMTDHAPVRPLPRHRARRGAGGA